MVGKDMEKLQSLINKLEVVYNAEKDKKSKNVDSGKATQTKEEL